MQNIIASQIGIHFTTEAQAARQLSYLVLFANMPTSKRKWTSVNWIGKAATNQLIDTIGLGFDELSTQTERFRHLLKQHGLK